MVESCNWYAGGLEYLICTNSTFIVVFAVLAVIGLLLKILVYLLEVRLEKVSRRECAKRYYREHRAEILAQKRVRYDRKKAYEKVLKDRFMSVEDMDR